MISNAELEEQLRMLRNYGSKVKYQNEIEGMNSRLDEVQAAMFSVKLRHLNELTEERKEIANYYFENIKNDKIMLSQIREGVQHVFHLFVVRTDNRDKLQSYLKGCGVAIQIHYPIPPHLSQCYNWMGYTKGAFPISEYFADAMLSIPLYNGMTKEEMQYVTKKIYEY